MAERHYEPHVELYEFVGRRVPVRCACPIGHDHSHDEWLEKFIVCSHCGYATFAPTQRDDAQRPVPQSHRNPIRRLFEHFLYRRRDPSPSDPLRPRHVAGNAGRQSTTEGGDSAVQGS